MNGQLGMTATECAVNEYIPPSIREQLLREREALMAKVVRIDEAIRLLDENPSYEKIHDAIVKTQMGRLR